MVLVATVLASAEEARSELAFATSEDCWDRWVWERVCDADWDWDCECFWVEVESEVERDLEDMSVFCGSKGWWRVGEVRRDGCCDDCEAGAA